MTGPLKMFFLGLIAISANSPARGSDHVSDSARSDTRVFILRGITEPAALVPPEQALDSGKMYMRLPDLRGVGQQHRQVAAKKASAASHHANVKVNHRVELSRSSLNQSETSKPLTFKTTKVSGEVRLPRVQFGRRGPPIELSDDMPSLDFTAKSLKDSGF